MTDTVQSKERAAFTKRLKDVLQQAGHEPDSPTNLAREFNLRFPGKPVTVIAARKWLNSEAMPTQEKLRTLADWLNVPKDWLRYGSDKEIRSPTEGAQQSKFTKKDVALIDDVKRLTNEQRDLVHKVILHMVKAQ